MSVGNERFRRDSTEMKKEVLSDGTVHQTISLIRTKADSQEKVGETIETFDQPPRLVQETEEIEEILPDGRKQKRKVSLKSEVHSMKTRHETVGTDSMPKVEDYELEEIVPNTTSCFDPGFDSDYEEELKKKNSSCLKVDIKTEEIEETLPDGTKVKKLVTLNRVVHTPQGEKLRFDERVGLKKTDSSTQEVVPGTISAFRDGQDSD